MIKFPKLAVWVMLTEAIIGWVVEDFSRNFLKNGISGLRYVHVITGHRPSTREKTRTNIIGN